ncbi:hypothetical protein FACS189430_05820 [Bacteroidia bacterium]|nr:hypothetical protein FACS189430_05820 [Bacteroidia bacterium]
MITVGGSGAFTVAEGADINAKAYAISISGDNRTVTVSGGTVSGSVGIEYAGENTTVTVSGGTITGGTVSGDAGAAIYASASASASGTITVSGGAIIGGGTGSNDAGIYISGVRETLLR